MYFLIKYLFVSIDWIKCSDCHKVMPTFDKFAEIMKTNNTQVTVSKIEAVDNRNISMRYNVTEVPTLKFFLKGDFSENYKGSYETESLVHWANNECKN